MNYNPGMYHVITHELRKLAECKTSEHAKNVFRSKVIGVKAIDAEGQEVKYSSMSEMARFLDTNCTRIRTLADVQGTYKGYTISYTGKEPYRPKAKTKAVKVVTVDKNGKNTIYKSKSSCANALNVEKHAIYWAIDKGKEIKGLSIYLYTGDLVQKREGTHYKKCMVIMKDGKTAICNSVRDAAVLLGVKYSAVTSAMHRGHKTAGATVKLLDTKEKKE